MSVEGQRLASGYPGVDVGPAKQAGTRSEMGVPALKRYVTVLAWAGDTDVASLDKLSASIYKGSQ